VHDLFSEESVTLTKDSFLVFFTDGVTEARNRNRDALGIGEFKAIVEGARVRTPEELVLALILDIQGFSAGSKQHDDITLVGGLPGKMTFSGLWPAKSHPDVFLGQRNSAAVFWPQITLYYQCGWVIVFSE
jgi:hypothetical protein